MASKILKTYLSPDIVDFCIIPYLLPVEKDSKDVHDKLLREFEMVVDWEWIYYQDIIKDESIVLQVLRNKSYRGKYEESGYKKDDIEGTIESASKILF
jgi:hypothetical protein